MDTLRNLQTTGAAQSSDPHADSATRDDKLSQSAKTVVRELGEMVGGASSAATAKAKDLLKEQLTAGGDIVSQIAQSTRVAGDELDREVPQLGALVKRAADSIEDVARSLRERSIEEVVQTAADFGRRQPIVLFGITAVLGYLAYRLVNEGVHESSGSSSS